MKALLPARALAALTLAIGLGCNPFVTDRCRNVDDCASGRACIAGRCETRDAGANVGSGSSAGADSGAGSSSSAGGGPDAGADSEVEGNALLGGHLYVAPHPDALLLFMNPDVELAVRANRPVHIVFITSGEGDGGLVSAQTQEMDALEATRQMAGTAAAPPDCAARPYAGKSVLECHFASRPLVRVSFLRLPDDRLVASLWARDDGPPLFIAPTFSLTTVDGADIYTKIQLLDVLEAIIAADQPQIVGTPDGTKTYGDDHLDSIATGDLVLAAAQRQPGLHGLKTYRGYNIYQTWGEPPPVMEEPNLSEEAAMEKRRLVEIVDGPLPMDGPLVEWCRRQYAIVEAAGGTGRLVVGGDGCLAAHGGTQGPPVVVSACAANPTTWTLRPDHQLEGPPGSCVTSMPDRTVRLLTCAGAVEQRWTLMQNGQLRTLDSTCLTRTIDGESPTLSTCGSDDTTGRFSVPASQTWTLDTAPTDGDAADGGTTGG